MCKIFSMHAQLILRLKRVRNIYIYIARSYLITILGSDPYILFKEPFQKKVQIK